MQKSQLINGVIIDWNKIDRGSYLKKASSDERERKGLLYRCILCKL